MTWISVISETICTGFQLEQVASYLHEGTELTVVLLCRDELVYRDELAQRLLHQLNMATMNHGKVA